MTDRRTLPPLAATGVWLVALIGSWTMAIAVLGSVYDGALSCGDAVATQPLDEGPVPGALLILVGAAVVPILVMVAAAPPPVRWRLTVVAVVVSLAVLWLSLAWVGGCLL